MHRTTDQARLYLSTRVIVRLHNSKEGEYFSLDKLFVAKDNDPATKKQATARRWQRETMKMYESMHLCKIKIHGRAHSYLYAADDRKALELVVKRLTEEDNSLVKYALFPKDYELPAWMPGDKPASERPEPEPEPEPEKEEQKETFNTSIAMTDCLEALRTGDDQMRWEALSILVGLLLASQERTRGYAHRLLSLSDGLEAVAQTQLDVVNNQRKFTETIERISGRSRRDCERLEGIETKVSITTKHITEVREKTSKVLDLLVNMDKYVGLMLGSMTELKNMMAVVAERTKALRLLFNLQRVKGQVDTWSRLLTGVDVQKKNLVAGLEVLIETVGQWEAERNIPDTEEDNDGDPHDG